MAIFLLKIVVVILFIILKKMGILFEIEQQSFLEVFPKLTTG